MNKPRFQLHLSTLLLLSIVTAALMYLNWLPDNGSQQVLLAHKYGSAPRVIADCVSRGWPFVCWSGYVYRPGTVITKSLDAQFDSDRLLYNVGVGVVLLAMLALLSEWRIRRRRDAQPDATRLAS